VECAVTHELVKAGVLGHNEATVELFEDFFGLKY